MYIHNWVTLLYSRDYSQPCKLSTIKVLKFLKGTYTYTHTHLYTHAHTHTHIHTHTYIYMNHFSVYLKLMKHYKSTILQFLKKMVMGHTLRVLWRSPSEVRKKNFFFIVTGLQCSVNFLPYSIVTWLMISN